ncbi:hypothetical protein [Lentzea terrae]|uniref:hypothetical protein n=1 Tax=Lentzea terrae TaxID=2200761 RepID=UPI000DD2FA12|nr:hypothetical protein [Lentzea terrae]
MEQVFEYADRVAVVRRAEQFAGYLLVTVPEMMPSPKPVTYVDMVFARTDAEEPSGWRFEDRADPGVESAQEELAASMLEWYGTAFRVSWLDDVEADRIRTTIFG